MNLETNPPASPSKAMEIAEQLRDRLFSCHHEDRTPLSSDMEYMVDRIDRLASLAASAVINVETDLDLMRSDWPLDRAIEMLTAYAELVKITGRYAEEHYIPEIGEITAALRFATSPAAPEPAVRPIEIPTTTIDALLEEIIGFAPDDELQTVNRSDLHHLVVSAVHRLAATPSPAAETVGARKP